MRYGFRLLALLLFVLAMPLLHAQIQPHRAHYTLTLQHIDPQSDLVNVQGQMIFDLHRESDTWVIFQDSLTTLSFQSGESETLIARYQARESFDGKELQFQSASSIDGAPLEKISGTAQLNDHTTTIVFKAPCFNTFQTSYPVIPPVMHIQKLIAAAQQGQKNLLQQRVFDGSAYGTDVGISTFICDAQPLPSLSVSLPKEAQTTYWPLKMGVFAQEDATGLPSFALTRDITPDGIMIAYTMDFGDYRVKGDLEKISFHEKP